MKQTQGITERLKEENALYHFTNTKPVNFRKHDVQNHQTYFFVKPCNPLYVRRRRASDEGEQLIYKNLKMDLTGHHVFCDGTEVVLTQKEFELTN